MKIIRSAKVVVLDAGERALLLRRSETHPTQSHEPDLPGGDVEVGESIEAGAVREILEETGLEVDMSALRLLHTFTYDDIPGVSINRLLYGVRIAETAPEVRLSWEHDHYRWVQLDDLIGVEKPYQMGVDYAAKHNLWASV